VTVLRSGSATDVGRVRKINQDLPLEAINLYAVADGMGGHVGGEVAAQVAVDALLRVFTGEPTTAGLRDAFDKANSAVWQEGQEHSELRGMGTTLTALALVGGDDGRDTLALANVGDSRAYLFSDGQIVQVTADHSLAEERMRHGEMTEEEAAVHPQRHILTRALGVSSEVEADMWDLQLRSGDRLVLCSDGLSNELTSDEMAEVLSRVRDPGEAAQELVEAANEHGGSDNITVVVVDVLVGEDTPPDASVITPLGARAGSPLLVGPASATGAAFGPGTAAGPGTASGKPASDAFAQGTQLGFGSQTRSLRGEGLRTGEFFPDTTQAVPVSRATDRSVPPGVRNVDAAPLDETRRERRRRLGIPRRITLRVLLFILLIAAVPSAAYFAIRWYAYDNWYVALQKQQIVVKQGRPGGVLWFHPRVVDVTRTTTSQVLPTDVAQIRAGVQEPSLQAAKRYVTNLQSEYVSVQKAKHAETNSSTTTTTTFPTTGATATTTPPTVPTTPTTAAATATAATTTVTTAAATATTTATTAATTATTTATTAPTTATTAAP
jgi:serine/threonine protein phosphatase PrpC